jgi:hypothetical protein
MFSTGLSSGDFGGMGRIVMFVGMTNLAADAIQPDRRGGRRGLLVRPSGRSPRGAGSSPRCCMRARSPHRPRRSETYSCARQCKLGDAWGSTDRQRHGLQTPVNDGKLAQILPEMGRSASDHAAESTKPQAPRKQAEKNFLLTEAPTNLRRSSSSEDEMVARGFVYTQSAAQSSLPAAEVFGS